MAVPEIQAEPCPTCRRPVLKAITTRGEDKVYDRDVVLAYRLVSRGTGVLYSTPAYGHLEHQCRNP